MARKSTTKSVADTATVDNSTVASVAATEENNNVEVTVETTTKKATSKNVVEPLEDYDEIDVVSLVPHVSYKDNKTGDFYEWDKVGHVEPMTVETLKNMWRNHKGYFRNMLLKPNDDRVIVKFGLKNVFEKYEFLMDESNYTRANINVLCETISNTPNGLKYAICNKVKDLVINGKVTDVSVIKALEKHLNLDLISFL